MAEVAEIMEIPYSSVYNKYKDYKQIVSTYDMSKKATQKVQVKKRKQAKKKSFWQRVFNV